MVERYDSPSSNIQGANSTIERTYIIQGTFTEQQIHNWVDANSPVVIPLNVGFATVIFWRKGYSAKPLGGGYYEVTVEYGLPEISTSGSGGGGSEPGPSGTGPEAWSLDEANLQFDTTGATTRMTQSIKTLARLAPPGQQAPDFKGAIGVREDDVEGVDITVPQLNIKVTKKLPFGFVNHAYIMKLFFLTGTVNKNSWRGFGPREVLFLGASGSLRTSDWKWEITYHFAFQPSIKAQDGFMIGDIGPIEKKGWDYLWVRYEETVDKQAKALIRKPVAVYIEQVYPEDDFSKLGI